MGLEPRPLDPESDVLTNRPPRPRDVMDGLVICKNEEDPIKNEGATVFTTLYINFSDAQGQITPESVMVL